MRFYKTPGAAEAGLLFSVMTFLHVFGSQYLSRFQISVFQRIVVSQVIFIALPPLLFCLVFKLSFVHTFKIKRPKAKEIALISLIFPFATLSAYGAGIVAIDFLEALFGELRLQNNLDSILSGGIPLALLAIGVVPPFFEELAFRGFLQRGMEGLGPRKLVVLSGILFGLFHFEFQRLAAQSLLGMVMAYVVLRTGSVFSGMLIHLLHNAGTLILINYAPRIANIVMASRVIHVASLIALVSLLYVLHSITGANFKAVKPHFFQENEIKKSSAVLFIITVSPGLFIIIWFYAAMILQLLGLRFN